jgi:hypothetical protein
MNLCHAWKKIFKPSVDCSFFLNLTKTAAHRTALPYCILSRFPLPSSRLSASRLPILPDPVSKQLCWPWSHTPPVWLYERVKPALEMRALYLSVRLAQCPCLACTQSPLCLRATTTHKERPMCETTNERSNINVQLRVSEQAVYHSELNVFQLREEDPQCMPVKCVFIEVFF